MALFSTVPQAARCYTERGLIVVPVKFRDKAPSLGEGWQKVRPTLAELDRYFDGQPQNIGILLGIDNLADVDLDSREALWAWHEFQLETGFCFGRHSKPASHHFYYLDEALRTIKYRDPLAEGETKAMLLELRCVTSADEPGLQTIVPPSIHPSGERVEFAGGILLMPDKAEAGIVRQATDRTAGTALLGRYAPAKGARHDYFLAVAGALAHAKWDVADALKVVRSLYRIVWGERADLARAERETESTFQRYDDGGEITGLPHLAEMLDPRILKAATGWLGLEKKGAPPPKSKKTQIPVILSAREIREKELIMPENLIQEMLTTPSLTLIVGPPKAGKTILGVQMVLSIAKGKPLFGYYSTRQANALIIETDDPQGDAALKNFALHSRAAQENDAWCGITQCQLALGEDLFRYLKGAVGERQSRVLLLDSYTSLRAYRPAGSTDVVKLEAEELTQLAEFARAHATAILLVHHDAKSSAHLDWSARAAGSFAVTAATDAQIFVSRFPELPENDGARLVRLRGRHLAGKEMVLRFRETTFDYDHVLEGGAAIHYPEIRALWRSFRELPFSAKDISGELGWTRPTTYRIMQRLVQSGVLIKDGTNWAWDPHFTERKDL